MTRPEPVYFARLRRHLRIWTIVTAIVFALALLIPFIINQFD